MIRVILSWLGWVFIAFGLAEVCFETYLLLQSGMLNDDVISAWPRSKFFGRGMSNIALGAIMVGVYQLLMKSDEKEKE
jgi:hypothetical protein